MGKGRQRIGVQVNVIAVGRLRPAFRDAADDYLRRLRRHGRITEVEVREAGRAGSAVAQRREEARRLRDRLPDGARVVALTRNGTAWTSVELTRQVVRWGEGGRPVALLIGGAVGLDPELARAAEVRWSLGPLTLPHELARLVVLEQVYRAMTILAGSPYHKGGC